MNIYNSNNNNNNNHNSTTRNSAHTSKIPLRFLGPRRGLELQGTKNHQSRTSGGLRLAKNDNNNNNHLFTFLCAKRDIIQHIIAHLQMLRAKCMQSIKINVSYCKRRIQCHTYSVNSKI